MRLVPSALLVLLLLTVPARAQIQQGGAPLSSRTTLGGAVPTETMPPVDPVALLAGNGERSSGEPFRWAVVHEVDLGLRSAGRWDVLADGSRVWRLRVESRHARSLMLSFSRYQLPVGAELFVYDDARATVRGAYTYLNNREDGRFAVQATAGDAVTLEYVEPKDAIGQGELALSAVLHDYVGIVDKGGKEGTSGACNVDVACSDADSVRDQVRSIVTILTASGTCCSGVLMNNTAQDQKPYVLTAQHCGGLTNAIFQFNWKRPTCGSGSPIAQSDTVFGSVARASNGTLDFQLVELATPPPATFAPYYSGWDNTDVQPTSAKCLHHPSGDVMKVSVENNLPRYSQTFWKIRIWDVGVTESGSSGAPLFDQNARVVGQLKGGSAACGNPIDDFFGRIALQWTQMQPYLDPMNSGATVLDGFDPMVSGGFAVTGVVPRSVLPLSPGTAKTVILIGSGFTPSSTVCFDGQAVPASSFQYVASNRIDVNLPLAAIGSHVLEVTEAGQTDATSIAVVEASTPIHEAGNGNALNSVSSAAGVNLTNADTVGHTNVTLWSFSNAPSVHPIITLAIGNNFTDIMRANLVTVPADGYVMTNIPVPPSLIGSLIYSQSYCPRCPSPPTGSMIQVSNAQSVLVVP